jgi:hypothetical protein
MILFYGFIEQIPPETTYDIYLHHKQPLGKVNFYCQQRLHLQLLAAGERLLGTPILVK